MLASFALTAQPRTILGKRPSRRLRRLEGCTPGILYGGSKPPLALSFDHAKLLRMLDNPAFYSHILTITVHSEAGETDEGSSPGDTHQAVLKALQRHPFKPNILHLDLLRVSSTEKITLSVPLRFVGAAIATGVKQEGGIVSHLLTRVEVNCLPICLPEHLDVDISHLGLNETITLSQLPLPEGVALASHGDDQPVVTIHLPRVHSDKGSTETPATSTVQASTDGGKKTQ
jgi:large subunit ribosomal protein L25